jgi:DNA-binding transcriptional ArsR family regulator
MESTAAIERLGALAHPARLAVFRRLVQAGPSGMAAGEIARALDAPANTLSNQLAILSRAGLIHARRQARSIIYATDYGAVRELLDFLTQDCCNGHPEVCGVAAPLACAGSGAMAAPTQGSPA